MAGYVFSFTAESSDIGNTTAGSVWQEITLSDTEGSYVNPAVGHQAIDISVIASATGTAHTLTLAWVDCDANKTAIGLGVTKIDTITATPGTRRTNLANNDDGYVCAVSAASSSSSIVRTIGIGSMIDLRSSPVNLPKRRLFIGLTTLGGGGGTVTVIVTPTRIL